MKANKNTTPNVPSETATVELFNRDPLFRDFVKSALTLSVLVNMVTFITWVVIEMS